MKKGLIVYNQIDRNKNEWLIERCLKELNNDNFSLFYKEENETLSYVKQNKVDFVIFRARNFKLIEELESLGIRVFNNSQTNKTANDKYQSYLFCKMNNLPCVETFKESRFTNDSLFIMKSVDGHGGQEVYLVKNKEDEKKIIENTHKTFVYQRFIDNAVDVRLYVLNKQVIGAVKRENSGDFRSNYSLGGNVSSFEPSQDMKELAIKTATLLNSDYIGVDFIINDKVCLINEIEDPVGARMLYKTSNVDIVSLFIQHIKDIMSN